MKSVVKINIFVTSFIRFVIGQMAARTFVTNLTQPSGRI